VHILLEFILEDLSWGEEWKVDRVRFIRMMDETVLDYKKRF
jgi:hypothetical protein